MVLRLFPSRLLNGCFACSLSLMLATSVTSVVWSQAVYEQVHSFGLGADSGAYSGSSPLVGPDGRIYGSTIRGGLADAGTLFRSERDGSAFRVLHNFIGANGQAPLGKLAQDEAGFLYGVTSDGGAGSNGVLYRIKTDGSGYTILKDFPADGSDGVEPVGGLLLASNGLVYGTTWGGGANGAGTLFSINTDGSDFTILRHFGEDPADAAHPRGILFEGTDGLLYGTTEEGGTAGVGTVFRLTKFSFGYEVLKSFTSTTDGEQPFAGVVEGSDGRLYGTLVGGGPGGTGAAFALNTDGTGFTLLHSFVPADGTGLLAGVCEASDGALYTIISSGNIGGGGAVFRFNKDGSGFARVRALGTVSGDPTLGVTSVTEGSDGLLYFSTLTGGAYGAGAVARLSKDGAQLQVLKGFSPTGSAPVGPRGDLVLGSDGFFYGTTEQGGANGVGAVFRILPDASGYSVVRSMGQTATDAALPASALLPASDGRWYGTTFSGGASGRGAVYVLNSDGSGYAVLRSFAGAPTDGAGPTAALIEGDDGLLYGATSSGGSSDRGTVFRMQKNGTGYTVLRSFTGTGGDGATPYKELLQVNPGVIYGVTSAGGTANAGTVFRLNPDGSGYAVLRSFSGAPQTPVNPLSALIVGSDGRLYGTSLLSGAGEGAVYSLRLDGSDLRTLATFPSPASGGTRPAAKLLQDSRGRLWGTCSRGGIENDGTVFALNPDGSGFEIVHGFTGGPFDGATPMAGLTLLTDGVVYGTTISGGKNNSGSMFRLSSPTAVRIVSFAGGFGAPFIAQIEAVPGWFCFLESSPVAEPAIWTPVANGQADAKGDLTLTDPTPSGDPKKFYRVRAIPSTAARFE